MGAFVGEVVDLLHWQWAVVEFDRRAVGQEEDAVEVVVEAEKCWARLLIEFVVAQLRADGELVALGGDVLLTDNKRSMLRKN